ncbi:hypothetical protein PPTG_02276 [Phytophthora nicotianae INRA-310]|uniref:Uncharacterized protein n=1 Tax=Phytophthora nicotianae (strain INRA-310) TaxID=761204 RepID=W2RA86_PHYN3|nr:hypothetical protein PPTG_02276 [Phytophthora nicotianae INRA-310]ETN22308.1 hypothetical protein PPTG_02276 [Phytophthora nicotianae INRA-310]
MRLDVTDRELQLVLAALLALGMDMDDVMSYLVQFISTRALQDRVALARKPFNLADLDAETCKLRLRFYPEEILVLEEALGLPATIYTAQMCPIPRQEALCLLLRRLAYPSRYEDLRSEFMHTAPVLSSAVNTTARMIYSKIQNKMEFDHRMIGCYKQRDFSSYLPANPFSAASIQRPQEDARD